MPVSFMSFPVQGMDFVWLIVLYENNQTYKPKFSDHVYAEHTFSSQQNICMDYILTQLRQYRQEVFPVEESDIYIHFAACYFSSCDSYIFTHSFGILL